MRQDERNTTRKTLTFRKLPDGTFELLINGEVNRSNISNENLEQEACVRFGYCGEEYQEILRELNDGEEAVRILNPGPTQAQLAKRRQND